MSEGCDSGSQEVMRTNWEKPAFRRIGADEAESGILVGPEILILLS